MAHEIFTIIGAKGKEIKGNKWVSGKKTKKTIVIAHGMVEYSFRYNDFAVFLNNNGYDVFALDHLAHGLNSESPDKVGYWPKDGFDQCVENVHLLIKKLKAEGREVYLFAHSMGSFMAQSYIERYPGEVSKVVLCGTGGKNPAAKMGAKIASLHASLFGHADKPSKFLNDLAFSGYFKMIKEKRTGFDWLSYNEENVDKYIADPYCGAIPTSNFFCSFIKGMSVVSDKKRIAKIDKNLKVLFIAGKEDPVGGFTKTIVKLEEAYKAHGLDCNEHFYDHMRHEILNEKNHQVVYDDVLAFFNK
jgi:alpha-beta hydrolase superfamily lysophospholipase